ncbi:hypothetical protein L9F63_017274 [Diploptera punctata]|uniref:OBP47-like domain-containing protein n=1 Tax=Diploptera punctata TaxID=6984 RepID=A0AAD8EGC4_DIPPU|nr:hypothetical protein L9F63_017274 [Diploptera punctata]
MKSIVAILFPTILCGVTVAFSILENYGEPNSALREFMLYHQSNNYMSALESQQAEDLENRSYLPLIRRTRDVGNSQCCDRGKKDLSSKDVAIFMVCLNETAPSEEQKSNQEEMNNRFSCVGECISKQYEVVDNEGYLIEDKLQNLAKDNRDNNEILDSNADYINRCVDFGNRMSKAIGMVKYGERTCNQASTMFVGCMQMLTDVNCPEMNKVQSPDCDKRRANYKKSIAILNI